MTEIDSNLKKGRRKKPQRGRASRVYLRNSNFQSVEKPQGSRNCEGGKGRPQGRAGHQKPDTSKGDLKVKRECQDDARVKPSIGRGAEQLGEKPRGWTESQNGNSRRKNRRQWAEAKRGRWRVKSRRSRDKGIHADQGRKP